MSWIDPKIFTLATGGRWLSDPPPSIAGVGIDSRESLTGRLFAAIPGPTHDGHDYLQEAALNGAVGAIIEREVPGADLPCFLVEDVRRALSQAGAFYRETLEGTRVVAITGSAGKTTTRKMLEAVLEPISPGTASPKSFNNALGVPLTLLSAKPEDRWLLAEVGTNAPGEIHPLGMLIRPECALITGIGNAHLEGFGTLEAVAAEKTSLLDTLIEGGKAFVNIDHPAIMPFLEGRDCSIVTYGKEKTADVRLTGRRRTTSGQEIEVDGEFTASLALPGEHNAINALGVIGVARMLGAGDDEIRHGLLHATAAPMRMERVDLGDVVVWNDAYNANPESVAAALATFVEEEHGTGRLVVILGEMLELGAVSGELHRDLGKAAASAGVDLLVGVGELGRTIVDAAREVGYAGETRVFESLEDSGAVAAVAAVCREGDRVLLKASRGVGMERVLEELRKREEVAR